MITLEDKNWSIKQLAETMDKSPSEVSQWLTGVHTLTLHNITKMEHASGIDLIQCEPVNESNP